MTTIQTSTLPEPRSEQDVHHRGGAPDAMSPLAVRVHGEYREMPGLHLTVRQAARLFNVAPDVADAVLRELQRASILAQSDDGVFGLLCEPRRTRIRRSR